MYDRVVTINNTHWPAYRKPGATLVDLRMFDPNDRSSNPPLAFRLGRSQQPALTPNHNSLNREVLDVQRLVQLAETETRDALQRAESDELHLQSQSDRRGSIAGTG
jgi:hypothetical protein